MVATTTAGELGTQAHTNVKEPAPAHLNDPVNQFDQLTKPAGGLWTSTMRPDGDSAWMEWRRSEHWEFVDDVHLYALVPDPDAEVLVIDSQTDLREALSAYGRTDLDTTMADQFAPLDFESIAVDYDGIHLSAAGQRDTRFSRPGLYGWDCESTLWFDWVFQDAVDLGPATNWPKPERTLDIVTEH